MCDPYLNLQAMSPPNLNQDYVAPLLFRNGHLQTIVPTLLRKVRGVGYQRERIETPDRDFLDLDWSRVGSETLVIISHGLEGNSDRAYVKGMVRAVNEERLDALAWNYRGCSGEPNRQLCLYHNGSIADLHTVIDHAAPAYRNLFLVGFSLGGNLSLLYLGKQAQAVPEAVKGCVAFSAPCDLTDASEALEKRQNVIYMQRFLKLLHHKIKLKQTQYPKEFDDRDYHRLKTFRDFDARYTAPVHGFASAEDYWQKCSSRPWLKQVRVPALIVNALDDPFLAGGCYPQQECAANPQVELVMTRHGGHVGFMPRPGRRRYWSEERTVQFIASRLSP